MKHLNNKVAVVTGASKGIGAATARLLAEHGAKVVLVARSKDKLDQLATEIEQAGGIARTRAGDVSQYSDLQSICEDAFAEFGSLDFVVNNAGVIDPISPLSDSDPMRWSTAIDINLKGVYHGLRAALPIMQRQGHGVIVNLSSGAANSGMEGWSHYCASKAASKMLTECAHKEVGNQGIVVVGLSPGTVATDMMATIRDSRINPVSQLDWSVHIPAEWAAKAVAFLCGPEGQQFAGQDFSIKTEEGRVLVGLK